MEIPGCTLYYNEKTETVEIRHTKNNTVILTIKLESNSTGTMNRIDVNSDSDNFWLAIKPADDLVFNGRLFGTPKLIVNSIDFELLSK